MTHPSARKHHTWPDNLTLRDLRRATRKAGGVLVNESAGEWCVYQVEAPEGEEWDCSGIRFLLVEWRRGDSVGRREAIEDAIERLSYGRSPIPPGDDRWLDIEDERRERGK